MSSRIANASPASAVRRPALTPVAPTLASAVTSAWLASRLDDDRVRVMDVRSADAFAAGHVPGAVTLDVRSTLFDARGKVVTPAEVALVMSTLGIGDEHKVVIVDEGRALDALAAGWALERYGHLDVHLLEGGFTRWAAEGRPVSRTAVRHPPASFTARVSA